MKLFFQILFRNYYIALKRLNKFGSTRNAARELSLSIFTWILLLVTIIIALFDHIIDHSILATIIFILLMFGILLYAILQYVFESDGFCKDILENPSKYRFKQKNLNFIIPLLFSFAPIILFFVMCFILRYMQK